MTKIIDEVYHQQFKTWQPNHVAETDECVALSSDELAFSMMQCQLRGDDNAYEELSDLLFSAITTNGYIEFIRATSKGC